jgi:hypothetical protein
MILDVDRMPEIVADTDRAGEERVFLPLRGFP